MSKALSNVVSDLKKSKFRENKYSLVLTLFLGCLLISCFQSKTIEVKSLNSKYFQYFDTEKNELNKLDKKFDLTQGKWIFLPKLNRLEFHPYDSGTLVFSMMNNGQFIFLNKPSRILVFPLMDNEALPFVGPSMKSSVDESNPEEYIEIYDESANDGKTLSQAFTEYQDQLFTPEQLNNKMKNLNKLPYYEMKRSKFNSFLWDNKFSYFEDVDKNEFSEWLRKAVPSTYVSNDSTWTSDDVLKLQKELIATLLEITLFRSNDFLKDIYWDYEDLMRSFRVHSSAMEVAEEIINENPKIQVLLKSYFNDMLSITENIIENFLNNDYYPFFSYSFTKMQTGVTMGEHIQNRLKDFQRVPRDVYIHEYAMNVLELSDMEKYFTTEKIHGIVYSNTEYTGLQEDDLDDLKICFFNLIKILADKLGPKLEKLIPQESDETFDSFLNSNEATQKEKEAGAKVREETYSPVATDEEVMDVLKKVFRRGNSHITFALKMQLMYFVPRILQIVEPKVLENLDQFKLFKDMEMQFSNDKDGVEALEAFRRAMIVYQFVTYDDRIDRGMYSHDSVTIFTEINRLLIR